VNQIFFCYFKGFFNLFDLVDHFNLFHFEQLFYLMSRGHSEEQARAMIVRGFIEPISKELPMEFAVELNRLIELEMEGSVG
jgi:hypothetical protein